jgi:hypothetical protein
MAQKLRSVKISAETIAYAVDYCKKSGADPAKIIGEAVLAEARTETGNEVRLEAALRSLEKVQLALRGQLKGETEWAK